MGAALRSARLLGLLCVIALPASAQPRSARQICIGNCLQQKINCAAPMAKAGTMTQYGRCETAYQSCEASCPPEAPAGAASGGMGQQPANPFNPQPPSVPDFSNNMGPIPPKVNVDDETFEQWAEAERERQKNNWQLEQNQRMLEDLKATTEGRLRALEKLAALSGFPVEPSKPLVLPPLKPIPFRPWKRPARALVFTPGLLGSKPTFTMQQIGTVPKLPPDVYDNLPDIASCGPFKFTLELDGTATSDKDRVFISFKQPKPGWYRVVFTLVLIAGDGERAETEINTYSNHAGGPWSLTSFAPFAAAVGQPNRPIVGWQIKNARFIDIEAAMQQTANAPPSLFGVKGSEYTDTGARTPIPCNQGGGFPRNPRP